MKNFKTLNKKQLNSVKGGETIMGRGHDAGGYFLVIDDGSSCRKEYIKGVFDH